MPGGRYETVSISLDHILAHHHHTQHLPGNTAMTLTDQEFSTLNAARQMLTRLEQCLDDGKLSAREITCRNYLKQLVEMIEKYRQPDLFESHRPAANDT